ncbi:toxin-antitoxin system YwqK family antitoxin [Polaribacter ponticola]|uniref:TonB C-terminal domain-containing protein n=1 Tax=Polaribacter ponticola TaxID=2978475 RepID=A0ABT5S809_9FLAO|nr:hypothetical protein [Polaribacter sp. MSW5]MDD7914227.1 hypothetical protein [Polaribacter sp. MSW5]
MKNIFLIVFTFFLSFSCFSQKDSVVNYLDRHYKKVIKEQATYIQTIVKKDSLWLATVYFGNGKVKFQGNFKNKKLKTRVGVFKVYDESGNLKSTQNYNSKGKKNGRYSYFNTKGALITKGYFLNGKKEGVWKYLDNNLKSRARIVYKKGNILDYNLWNEEGITIKEKLIISRSPHYKKGNKSLRTRLNKELVKGLKNEGLNTNFLLKCSISKEGKVEDISITPNIGDQYKEKIISYFLKFDGMQPGIIANMKVKFPLELPFIFN